MTTSKTVFVVDDDDAVRDSLAMLISSVGLAVETFESAAEFLAVYVPSRPGCVVLDIRMPGLSGLDLQQRLKAMGATLPIIFISGHGDVPMAVRAMRRGAVDFLLKPFNDQELLDRIHHALELEKDRRREKNLRRNVEQRMVLLTPREKEVMGRVIEGETNKVIASRLGLSRRTVEIHRARVMEKMQATSLAQLVWMVLATSEEPPEGLLPTED